MRAGRWLPFASALALLGCGAELVPARAERPPAQDDAPGHEAPRAAKERGSAPASLRVAVVSDLNGSYGSRSYGEAVHGAVARLRELSPDLVLSTGDMVAGQRPGLDYEGMWASFHAAVSDRLADAGIPFAVSPGNHDASGYPRYAHERAIYVEEWRRRRPELDFQDGTHFPLRYSFAMGPALFVAIDATTVGPLDDEQMAWLDEQLALGARHPVKIVFGHVPLYPFAEGRRSEHIGDPALEDLLARHQVSLFLSGHHHAYYPGRRGPLRLVSMACLGGGARPLLGERHPSERSLLLFEITDQGVRELDAYAGPRFDRKIERESLPPRVGLPGMQIVRDDLELTLR
ncbi:MAG TPA: metallophosphoesterase [Sandaracinaceae bacterium]